MEQQEIINGCLKGERQAQKALYDRLSGRMFAVCLRYAIDESEAQDMLQEGFIRMFSNLEQYAGTGSFEGWARRIFIHTAIKYFHKTRKHRFTYELDSANERPVNSDAVGEMTADEMLALVQKLPEGYRMVFNLYAIEGFSHKEIADMLEIGESTSRSQLVKARKLLQQQVVRMQKVFV